MRDFKNKIDKDSLPNHIAIIMDGNGRWAKEKGLYSRVFETIKELDSEIQLLAERIASFNPEATRKMKAALWKGTDDWDTLLAERASISGELVLSEFTKNALQKFKK